ncbi:MAG: electron transfer flavoprotein subunit alpha/FixB family protein [Planctomycetes bacterium]|nr:electron transfer flavoprotein subunit alpha/FixB family protein [Planctomycetota bacterium]
MSCIIAIAEQSDGKLKKVAGEVASEALRLGKSANLPVVGLAIGPGAAAAAAQLGAFGVANAIALEGATLAPYSGEAYAAALAAVVKARGAKLVLLGATSFARDLLGRLGALLDSSPAADCVAISANGAAFTARRPVYAGKALQSVAFAASPALASLRPNVFAATPSAGTTTSVETLAPAAPPAKCGRLVERVATGGGRIELTEAECIVAGGRGLKTPETFAKLLEPLAAALGAAVGASRAVVDAGWRPHGEQVGQTGKTVAPKLYFAVGISGAIQHLAGMRTSKTIVAINKDKEAPIFKVADYGIVGDVEEVLPALTEAVKKLKSGG